MGSGIVWCGHDSAGVFNRIDAAGEFSDGHEYDDG
jgi:hypothetical protein